MKHIHHIIPKHMNGSNDPENLIELSIQEHAEIHYQLYLKYGLEQDRIAWLGLSGIIGNEEAVNLANKLGRKIADQKLEEKLGPSWRKELGKRGGSVSHPNPNKKVSDEILIKALQDNSSVRAALRSVGLSESSESARLRVKRLMVR
jgi:hypothetical protein